MRELWNRQENYFNWRDSRDKVVDNRTGSEDVHVNGAVLWMCVPINWAKESIAITAIKRIALNPKRTDCKNVIPSE